MSSQKIRRKEGICCYGCEEKHPYKTCPIFALLKKKCNKESYICQELKSDDNKGYCAAGIMVECNGKVLFIEENRKGAVKLNLPGGKRESCSVGGKLRSETYTETAMAEFNEELSDLIEDGKDNQLFKDINESLCFKKPRLYWSGVSKYVLIMVELKGDHDKNLNDVDSNNPLFGWVKKENINGDLLHPFAYMFFKDIFYNQLPYHVPKQSSVYFVVLAMVFLLISTIR